MEVTIELYRSRIGSHYNFMEGHKSNFQSQFWNEIRLKSCIIQYVKKNAHYPGNVYNTVQLLLRLSNDVQGNPGPTINDIVDCSYTIHAN